MRSTLNATLALFLLAACGDPVGPPGEARWTEVSAGDYHGCGIVDFTAYCWGPDVVGALGRPAAENSRPAAVVGGLRFRTVSTGGAYSCGVAVDDAAYCWGGLDVDSPLGAGTLRATWMPVPVSGGLKFRELSAGSGHVCGITPGGEAHCWGSNWAGELGTGAAPGRTTVPMPVQGGRRWRAISSGTVHTCGIAEDSLAYCWGAGSNGRLGIGDLQCAITDPCVRSTPQAVVGGIRFAAISAGNGFTCGVAVDGAGWCWGGFEPFYGVLGTGSAGGSHVPVRVAGGHRFTMISAGTRSVCGLRTDGVALCWGTGGSVLGSSGNTETVRPTPRAVSGGLRFRSVSVGEVACGITTGGAGYCWGSGRRGMLGNGDSRDRQHATPVPIRDPVS